MIRIRNLGVRYGERAALNDISLELVPGRVTVLLGPSGAGKTTLLKTLNGLVTPCEGDIVDDHARSVFRSREALNGHRRRTAMIFQHHDLVGRSSAHANVLNGRLAHLSRLHVLLPIPRRHKLLALQALDRVGLLEKAFSRADRLSGGEQQRVGVARALVQGARLLLADEPVASLDPTSASLVLDIIAKLTHDDGLTTVVSLHQVQLARRYADRIIGLNGGEVVFDGSPSCLTEKALARIYRKQHLRSVAPDCLASDDKKDFGASPDHALDRA